MIQVELSGTGKKFLGKWVFRGIELPIGPEKRQVIAGKNGRQSGISLLFLSRFLHNTVLIPAYGNNIRFQKWLVPGNE